MNEQISKVKNELQRKQCFSAEYQKVECLSAQFKQSLERPDTPQFIGYQLRAFSVAIAKQEVLLCSLSDKNAVAL